MTALTAALILGAYLVGAIPFGLLIARRVAQVDVRTVGSGNIGATNVARAAGKKTAGFVLLLDVLKGYLPSTVALALGVPPSWSAVAGVAAFLGHCFPVYLRFRGGKGVATALGVALALEPLAALAGVLTWIVLYLAFRVSSLGSLGGVIVALSVAVWLGESPASAWAILVMAAVIILRHRSNIRRLIRREEGRV